MNTEILTLLAQTSTEVSDDTYTHITLFPEIRKWHMRPDQLNNFWVNYCRIVYNDEDLPVGLAERALDYNPLVLHYKFRFHVDNFDHRDQDVWTRQFLIELIAYTQRAMVSLLDIGDNKTELICCVLNTETNEFGTHNDEKIIIRTLCLHFPNAKSDYPTQSKIRDKAVSLYVKNNLMAELEAPPIDSWDTITRLPVANGFLPMYGSRLTPTDLPLRFEEVIIGPVPFDENDFPAHYSVEDQSLLAVFFPTTAQIVKRGLNPKVFSNCEHLEWVPLFFSVYYSDVYKLARSKPEIFDSSSDSLSRLPMNARDFAKIFMSMISPNRCKEISYWLDIGRALFTCTNGDEEGLEMWGEITDSSGAFSFEDCEAKYQSLRDSGISYKTLASFAREDSKEKYDAWHQKWIQDGMEEILSSGHSDNSLSTLLYRIYWLDFVCTKLRPQKWFHFTDHHWKESDEAVHLYKSISEDFRAYFTKMRAKLNDISGYKQANDIDRKASRRQTENQLNTVSRAIKYIDSDPGQRRMMSMAAKKFYDERFKTFQDKSPRLLGMRNGVIEIQDEIKFLHSGRVTPVRVIVRPGKYEDYITKNTGVRYNHNYTWDSPAVKATMKWMNQLFAPDIYLHAMKMCASFLRGRNSDKILYFWVGTGDNGKSVFVKFFEASFGEYCFKFPSNVLTGKETQSSQATPEIIRGHCARIAFFEELPPGAVIDSGRAKKHTGGDKMYGRGLYQEGGEIEGQYKMIGILNKAIPFSHPGKAEKNRLIIIPFDCTYSHNAPANEAEQDRLRVYPIDKFFEDCVPELSEAFIWMLVQYYPTYRNEGLFPPERIKVITDEYWREYDIYEKFQETWIETPRTQEEFNYASMDQTYQLTARDLYTTFKSWFHENYPTQRVPNESLVRAEFTNRWEKPINAIWRCKRIKQNVFSMVPPVQ